MVVIGACLLIAQRLRPLVLPVAALGAMPLTTYSLHVVAYFAIAGYQTPITSNRVFALMTLVLLIGCTAWQLLVGRGPFERIPLALGRAMSELPRPRNGGKRPKRYASSRPGIGLVDRSGRPIRAAGVKTMSTEAASAPAMKR